MCTHKCTLPFWNIFVHISYSFFELNRYFYRYVFLSDLSFDSLVQRIIMFFYCESYRTDSEDNSFFKRLNILDVIKSSKHKWCNQKNHCMQRKDGRATYERCKYLML